MSQIPERRKREYTRAFGEFMRYIRNREYPDNHKFQREELSDLVPEDICKWMCHKAFGRENPRPEDKTRRGMASSLNHHKSGISYFMPDRLKRWDETCKNGNPTRSKMVTELIKTIREREEHTENQTMRQKQQQQQQQYQAQAQDEDDDDDDDEEEEEEEEVQGKTSKRQRRMCEQMEEEDSEETEDEENEVEEGKGNEGESSKEILLGPSQQDSRKKDPLAPKNIIGSYLHFLEEFRAKMNDEYPNMKSGDVCRVAEKRWKALTSRQRRKYEDMRDKDARRYHREMKIYMRKKKARNDIECRQDSGKKRKLTAKRKRNLLGPEENEREEQEAEFDWEEELEAERQHEEEEAKLELHKGEMLGSTSPSSCLFVQGAGQPVVNGVYVLDGTKDKAWKYSMLTAQKNDSCIFSLFLCSVREHWYISMVPRHNQPGTSVDIDFYSAPVTIEARYSPPNNGWSKCGEQGEGVDPPPNICGIFDANVVGSLETKDDETNKEKHHRQGDQKEEDSAKGCDDDKEEECQEEEEMDDEVRQVLERVSLTESEQNEICRLGAKTLETLAHIQDHDLEKLGIPILQRRALLEIMVKWKMSPFAFSPGAAPTTPSTLTEKPTPLSTVSGEPSRSAAIIGEGPTPSSMIITAEPTLSAATAKSSSSLVSN